MSLQISVFDSTYRVSLRETFDISAKTNQICAKLHCSV